MEFKLSSGRVVEINRPSVKDRMRCGDISKHSFEITSIKDGVPTMGRAHVDKPKTAAFNWAAAALGVDLDDLDEYTDLELVEIGKEAQALANLNPASAPN